MWQILFWNNICIYQIQIWSLHCLVCPSAPNLTDVTLVCKNANWKLVNVAEECINYSLVEKLKFGQDIKAEFFATFFSWSLVQTWSTWFSQDFEIDVLIHLLKNNVEMKHKWIENRKYYILSHLGMEESSWRRTAPFVKLYVFFITFDDQSLLNCPLLRIALPWALLKRSALLSFAQIRSRLRA